MKKLLTLYFECVQCVCFICFYLFILVLFVFRKFFFHIYSLLYVEILVLALPTPFTALFQK